MRVRSSWPAVLTTIVLILPALVHAGTDDRRHSWSAGWEIAGRPDLHLHTDDARVRLHATDDDSVTVRVRAIGKASGILYSHRDPHVSFDRSGNRVDIEVLGGAVSGLFVISTQEVEVDVWAPRGSDVTLRSGDGRVELAGLSGRIDVSTGDGSIKARELEGTVSLRSGDGHVIAEGIDGNLMVYTKDGGAEVSGRFTGLGVQSGDGRIAVTLEQGSNLRQGGSIESGDGGILVRIPTDMRLTFDARTSDGGLHVDLPVEVSDRGERHEVHADLNGGGPHLSVRSHDGSVQIQPL
jgi:DUF4097 and DUF4098 domain-containing protein YvlB